MKKVAALGILLTMTGCLSLSPSGNDLEGPSKKNISSAFKTLGYPNRKEEKKNETVYYWTKVTRESFNTYRCHITIVTDPEERIINTFCQGEYNACRKFGKICKDHLQAPDEPLKQPAP